MTHDATSPWWRQVALGGATGAAQVHLRSQQARDDLLVAAGREFAEHGYRGATLDAITWRSGLTKGALYFHFRSKRDLAENVLLEARRRIDAVCRRHGAPCTTPPDEPNPPDELGGLIETTAALHAAMAADPVARAGPRLSREWPADTGVPVLPVLDEPAVGRVLARARDRRTLRPDVDPDQLAAHAVAMLVGHRATLESGAVPDPQLLRQRVVGSWQLLLATAADPGWYRSWARAIDPDGTAG